MTSFHAFKDCKAPDGVAVWSGEGLRTDVELLEIQVSVAVAHGSSRREPMSLVRRQCKNSGAQVKSGTTRGARDDLRLIRSEADFSPCDSVWHGSISLSSMHE